MEDRRMSELNDLLDRALAASRPQVPLELDARVLERIARAESTRKRRRTFVFGIGALAASIAVVVLQPKPEPLRPASAALAFIAPPRAVQVPSRQLRLGGVLHRKRRGEKQRLYKANVFPSPSPLTGEERALLRFVEQSPEAAEKAFAEVHQQEAQPLRIEALKIIPLADEQPHSGERP